LSPRKTEVQGLSIPEYELPAARSKKYPKRWIMGEWNDGKPEEAVAFYLREQTDCDVMLREGEMVKSLLDALCIAAYSERAGTPIVHKTGNLTTFGFVGLSFAQPESEFTRLYVHRFFQEFSVDQMGVLWSSLMNAIHPLRNVGKQEENDPDLIELFIDAITVPRLLTMFDVALSNDGVMSGWPDLTVMQDGRLIFVEVKVDDRLTPKQIEWFDRYAELAGDEYQVIRLLSV
jgi:hypothetical protein